MAKLGDKCRLCGSVMTEENSGWLPSDDPEGFRYHHFHECITRLRAEVERQRVLILSVSGEADWSLAATDPHDWRKGLEIIKTRLEGESKSEDEATLTR